MILIANILVSLLCAVAAASLLPLEQLSAAFTPLTTVISIMAAAVLVRLNRGMPTIDWKGVELERREKLTSEIVELAGEYLGVIAIIAALLVLLLVTTIAGEAWWLLKAPVWVTWVHRADSGLIVGLLALTLMRMGYVAWRDFDVVRMQKAAVDQAAKAEDLAKQVAAAEKKTATIQSAGLRPQPTAKPQAWDA